MQCHVWCSLGLLLTLLQVQSSTLTDCEPPRITHGPKRKIFFVKDGVLELPCIANGTKTLEYTWLKDGREVNLRTEDARTRMSVPPASAAGSLTVSAPTYRDEGRYQCRVKNGCGTFLSDVAVVRRAWLRPFTGFGRIRLEKMRGEVGQPLKLTCRPPGSVPQATISWMLLDPQSSTEVPLRLDERVTMDYHGNLYITALRKSDEQGGKQYVCRARNAQARSVQQGDAKLVSTWRSHGARMLIDFLWHSEERVLALVGDTVRFKCIFSGSPQPIIKWERTEGGMLTERMAQSDDMFELRIADVDITDAGHYECIGFDAYDKNEQMRKRFYLKVESAPVWQTEPGALELETGEDDAAFVCTAEGRPEPSVRWFVNGLVVSEESSREGIIAQEDLLILKNVSTSDPKVIQCNVSNEHGYLWADFHLRPVEATPPPSTTTTTTTITTTTTTTPVVFSPTTTSSLKVLTSSKTVTSLESVTSRETVLTLDESSGEEEAVSVSPLASDVIIGFSHLPESATPMAKSQETNEAVAAMESSPSSASSVLPVFTVPVQAVTVLWWTFLSMQ